jgi:NTP pyrophosphatase (non-canonical NTP hydrolase)
MKFKLYEEEAAKTDQFAADPSRSLEISKHHIMKEVFSLLRLCRERTPIQKLSSHQQKQIVQKTGDILWFLANLSRHMGFSLEKAAKSNLEYIKANFSDRASDARAATETTIQLENLPRKIEVAFIGNGDYLIVATGMKNREYIQLGDRINDNFGTEEDFYRYHDVFHLAYMTILGWSPVMRSLFKRKRKTTLEPSEEEREDGARAGDLEEAITAYVFEHARQNGWFHKDKKIDLEVLETIRTLTAHLEVRTRTYEQWEKAILTGYEIFALLKKHRYCKRRSVKTICRVDDAAFIV